jgi:hypothetical protein
MSKTSLLCGWVNLHTVEARVDSGFWYGLADRFRLCDEAGEISARVNVGRAGAPSVSWIPSPIRYTIARSQFERLALEAWSGIQLPVDEHNQGGGIYFSKMVGAWLDIVLGLRSCAPDTLGIKQGRRSRMRADDSPRLRSIGHRLYLSRK